MSLQLAARYRAWRGGHELGRGPADWMCTASGLQYFPANPRVEDVRIEDIAHHLSRLCRYTGAIRAEHYSVAEHSWHVSYAVPEPFAFMGLMHDAPEAYTNDLSRPLKRSLPDYKRIELLNWRVICECFNLPIVLPDEVHDGDVAVYLAERPVLMPPLPAFDPYNLTGKRAKLQIYGWAPNKAREMFLLRFKELWLPHMDHARARNLELYP